MGRTWEAGQRAWGLAALALLLVLGGAAVLAVPCFDEGFRESEGSVRAFRFGSVSDSYAARRGKDRNVGVVGVAVFREQGSDFRWSPEELDRRETADPFPSHFAPPP